MLNKKILLSIFLLIVWYAGLPPALAAKKALLIGVSYYTDKSIPRLDGPDNDVRALKQVLLDYWSFQASDIKVLLNDTASKTNILAALEDLYRQTGPGDQVFIFFSGHGTSIHNEQNRLPLPYTSGALLPADFTMAATAQQQMSGLLIGKTDLRPLLIKLDQGKRNVFVAFDSCYSGNAVRGVNLNSAAARLPRRYVKLDTAVSVTSTEQPIGNAFRFAEGTRTAVEEYPYQQVYFLSAASDSEQAVDISEKNLLLFPTLDGLPHGAFTDALLRTLSGREHADINLDGRIDYGELHGAIKRFMEKRYYPHNPQVLPQLKDDQYNLASRSIFGLSQNLSDQPLYHAKENLRVQITADNPGLIASLQREQGIKLASIQADVIVQENQGDYQISSGAGDLIGEMHAPSIKQIAGQIGQLAWLKQLTANGNRKARFNMTLSRGNSAFGSSVKLGETFNLTVKSEKPIYLLLLNINAEGHVSVLYPANAGELTAIPENATQFIPGAATSEQIAAVPPLGTDYLFAYGFAQKPAFLDTLQGKSIVMGSTEMQGLQHMLANAPEYAFSTLQLLTVAK